VEADNKFDFPLSNVQVLMKEAEQTPNVVKATNRPKLYDELENIQERLAVCEKALAEYLETKRLAFPRFYFISSSDLLDILSKGNQPVKVYIPLTVACTVAGRKLNTHYRDDPRKE
jgi:dynein heavy chain